MGGWTCKWVGRSVSKWIGGLVSGWVSPLVSGWVGLLVSGWVKQSVIFTPFFIHFWISLHQPESLSAGITAGSSSLSEVEQS